MWPKYFLSLYKVLTSWPKPNMKINNTLATFGQLAKALYNDNKNFGHNWPNVAKTLYEVNNTLATFGQLAKTFY